MPPEPVLGVDIGSVAISVALVSSAAGIDKALHTIHKGRIHDTLRSLAAELGPVPLSGIACTSSGSFSIKGARSFDPQVSLIASCRAFFPEARSIIFVGGEKFGLIRLDGTGTYRGARTSSSCAAGTGSFLDQQARRLGFPGIDELVRRALASTTRPPKISTRCAVFARTDLVHAQQAGHSLEEICDGLCKGLAQNIADTLLGGEPPLGPIVFAGGVALNMAVRRHLERILGSPLLTHPHAQAFGAAGAALCLAEEGANNAEIILLPDALGNGHGEAKQYYYEPLAIPEPSGDADGKRLFNSGTYSAAHPVEVEIYSTAATGLIPVRMGIDVGSTSTKAILIDEKREPIAGFYTRTLGSPLSAVQAICEAVEDMEARMSISLRFLGVGTTGAGRKFIGSLVKADLVVNEITAHARAAYELDPAVDTIIEIGGQDAKFTTVRDGMVTFSHMNTVCAAGTGSFLEEQAERLGCSLADYEQRVRGARAPLSSDRCAVFMERDINNFLAQGFSTEEILAAALYSVRENYMRKVARGAAIGNHIAFQGATARNKALVAAFREGLGKPVQVSRYCHLTGALGAALLLAEEGKAGSTFLGLAALRTPIPVRAETCTLCSNHCRLRIATVGGETVAYGFLCGRDYDVHRFVDKNKSGFDLIKERRAAFAAAAGPAAPEPATGPVIGIPAALGLYGQLPLWKRFFSLLGIPTVTTEGLDGSIDAGREVQGAEFCAPLAALHGHVQHLQGKADWIFLPVLLEESRPNGKGALVHCYYTQYSSALVSGVGDKELRSRCLMPQASWTRWRGRTKRELWQALRHAGLKHLMPWSVSHAFEQATAEHEKGIRILQSRFREVMAGSTEPAVVLLGRPYTVLSPEMGKGIPAIFGSLGVKAFYQDMVPYAPADVESIAPLLDMVHWLNAATILEVACIAANTPNLYPVYITSFKCTPDSFGLEYFKRILDAKNKPYLILQLDDHDSTLGYETRIEAGVASFRNHAGRELATFARRELTAFREQLSGVPLKATFARRELTAFPRRMRADADARGRRKAGDPANQPASRALPIIPHALTRLEGRTLLFPNWDSLTNPLLVANLRREGIDARLLEEDDLSIRAAMRHNTGQCIPLNIIAQETIEFVDRHGLDPARTAVWMPFSALPCNLGMFVPFLKSLMQAEGRGMENIEVYSGNFYYSDISLRATFNAYKAFLAGGLLRRVGCRIRPYETEPGATDAAISRGLLLLQKAFETGTSRGAAMRAAAALFDSIPVAGARRPQVGVFGDLYVRDNDVMSQQLLHAIERAGGEAITTPYTDYVAIIAHSVFRQVALSGDHRGAARYRLIWNSVDKVGRGYRRHFARFLEPETLPDGRDDQSFLRRFGLRTEHNGESFENLLKILHLTRTHPRLALLVQCSPAFCCPSMVTEAMARDIESFTGVPVVNITYDGTGQYRNEVIVPYLKYARARPLS
jgi:predicted CoA-substrate-specific enzyme activase